VVERRGQQPTSTGHSRRHRDPAASSTIQGTRPSTGICQRTWHPSSTSLAWLPSGRKPRSPVHSCPSHTELAACSRLPRVGVTTSTHAMMAQLLAPRARAASRSSATLAWVAVSLHCPAAGVGVQGCWGWVAWRGAVRRGARRETLDPWPSSKDTQTQMNARAGADWADSLTQGDGEAHCVDLQGRRVWQARPKEAAASPGRRQRVRGRAGQPLGQLHSPTSAAAGAPGSPCRRTVRT
jgi:hypothetical protein